MRGTVIGILSVLVTGCSGVTPNRADQSPPRLVFRVYGGRAYADVFLFASYEFAPGTTRTVLRATATNFSEGFATAGIPGEIWNLTVRLAGQGANEQPGRPCGS